MTVQSDAATHRLVRDPDPDLVMAATAWPTNAAMIRDVAKLGYLKDEDYVLDPTYGAGTWWRLWKPSRLLGCNREADPSWDFRAMRVDSEMFDAVAFDPPYVSVGGRNTSGIPAFQQRYGMFDSPKTPQGVQGDINLGLNECFRVVKRGGIVLVKCQDYVSSGKLWAGTYHTLNHALKIGFLLVDRLEHIGGPRPQPAHQTQQHARRNYSTLYVLQRPRREKKDG